jgi:hypothetical protein
MTVTTTNITNWLGTRLTAQLSGDQLTAALLDATNYCDGYLQAMGVSATGPAYDSAVLSVAKASTLRQLDAMGIKAAGVNMGGAMTISSDVTENINQLFKMADERLKWAVLTASNKAGLYMHRNRGGQGI